MHAALPPASFLASFFVGYLAILAVPGPNLLFLGTYAGLHGLRGALPGCCGMAAGAASLALLVSQALSPFAAGPAGHAASGAALIATAIMVLRRRAKARAGGHTAGSVAAGFATALTNPVSGGYFAAQANGPMAASLALPLLVAVIAMGWFAACAALLALPGPRRFIAAREQPIRAAGAAILAVFAAAQLAAALPGFSGAG